MARLPRDMAKSVAFVGSRGPDGEPLLRGTMFFIGRRVGGTNLLTTFAVTARHVLDGIRANGQQGCFRLSLALEKADTGQRIDDSVWLDFDIADWVDHPDPSVDAAVMHMHTLHMFDIRPVPPGRSLTPALIDEEGIGEGEEVFMVGLFVNRPGVRRNIPIVRVGNIAAMPREKVYVGSPFGEMDAYLIEARSIGGLSGSPAFVHLGIARVNDDGHFVTAARPEGVLYWMGLVHGHFDGGLSHADETQLDAAATLRERVNMGIAIVVPADRILEIFEHPNLKTLEEQLAAAAPTFEVIEQDRKKI